MQQRIDMCKIASRILGIRCYERDGKPTLLDESGKTGVPKFYVFIDNGNYIIGTSARKTIARIYAAINSRTGDAEICLQSYSAAISEIEGYDQIAMHAFDAWFDYIGGEYDRSKMRFEKPIDGEVMLAHKYVAEPKVFLHAISVKQHSLKDFTVYLFRSIVGHGDYTPEGDIEALRLASTRKRVKDTKALALWHRHVINLAGGNWLSLKSVEPHVADAVTQILQYKGIPSNWAVEFNTDVSIKFEPVLSYFNGNHYLHVQPNVNNLTTKFVAVWDGDVERIGTVTPKWIIVSRVPGDKVVNEVVDLQDLLLSVEEYI